MPVEFLSDQQAARYGGYNAPPDEAQLERYFTLSDADFQTIRRKRKGVTRLGFAAQLTTLRFLGTFLETPADIPENALALLRSQLGFSKRVTLEPYSEAQLLWRHREEIRALEGYVYFEDEQAQWRFLRWLYARAWTHAERPSLLFDLATRQLLERRIILPGVTTLARLVATVRDRARSRLMVTISHRMNAGQIRRLEALLVRVGTDRHTPLDDLMRPPRADGVDAVLQCLRRVATLEGLGVHSVNLTDLPQVQLEALARHATNVKAQIVRQLAVPQRRATLLVTAQHLRREALDHAATALISFVRELFNKVHNKGEYARSKEIGALDRAAKPLLEVVGAVLDAGVPDAALRGTIFGRVERTQLQAAFDEMTRLTRPPDDAHYEDLLSRYSHVRRVVPRLLRTLEFAAGEAGQGALQALEALRRFERGEAVGVDDIPLGLVAPAWRSLVVKDGKDVDRRAFTFCTLELLRHALQRRDVYLSGARHWGDPATALLGDEAWKSARAGVERALTREGGAEPHLEQLAAELDAAYHRVAPNLRDRVGVELETLDGLDSVKLKKLDALEQPPSLLALHATVKPLVPTVDLPDLLLEVIARSHADAGFTPASGNAPRIKDLRISLCAVLLSQATNVGLEAVLDDANPALKRSRLSRVLREYLRGETVERANALLVNAQNAIPLARAWGGGELASADGLRFTVPPRSMFTASNPRYFGVGRGVTYYNFTSDQFTGFHGIVYPGSHREATFALDGLLEQLSDLEPKELVTDTGGYSDASFGLLWLMGYQFSPRLANFGELRFWRIDRKADYGELNRISKHRVNLEKIRRHWDDLLRLCGSITLGVVRASDALRALQSGAYRSSLGEALDELGRIAKTLYLLAYLDDPVYRRRILTQGNRHEGRHALMRDVSFARRGLLYQSLHDGMAVQLASLSLVTNAIVLWNTWYMNLALEQLARDGVAVDPADVSRLSPLAHTHIRLYGRYRFVIDPQVARGGFRALGQGGNGDVLDGE